MERFVIKDNMSLSNNWSPWLKIFVASFITVFAPLMFIWLLYLYAIQKNLDFLNWVAVISMWMLLPALIVATGITIIWVVGRIIILKIRGK